MATARIPTFMEWTRPYLAGCEPIPHSGPPRTVPPCPAQPVGAEIVGGSEGQRALLRDWKPFPPGAVELAVFGSHKDSRTAWEGDIVAGVRDLADAIRAGAARSGAELMSLSLLTPEGMAPAVEIRVDDPPAYLANRARVLLEALAVRLLEGWYVRAIDGSGRVVWEARVSWRVETFGSRVPPELEGYNPMPGPRPCCEPPPPCPA